MYLVLLLLAQTAASPKPAASPAPASSPTRTPVVTDPTSPKTLQDLARERRGKPKPAGSLSTYQGVPGSGEPITISGGRPTLRVVEVVASTSQKAAGGFVGVLKNVGTQDACEIRITVEALDTKGKGLGSLEVAPGVTILHPGETASFEGVVNTGKSVSKEEAELGGGAVEHDVRAKGGSVVGSFRASVKNASECK